MSADSDRLLRIRFRVGLAVFGVLVVANILLSLRLAAERREHAQIESQRQQEIEAAFAEMAQTRDRASQINTQTEQIVAELTAPRQGTSAAGDGAKDPK